MQNLVKWLNSNKISLNVQKPGNFYAPKKKIKC